MSRLFDALQRAETERAGADASTSTSVTELLRRAELRLISDRERTVEIGQPDSAQSKEQNVTSQAIVELKTAKTDSTLAPALSLKEKVTDPEQLDQCQSIEVRIPPQNRLVSLMDGESLAAEKFRFLGVRLQHLRRERPLKKLLITSSIPQEGKSTVSANLACMLARRTRQKVLLVEGDIRRPSLSKMFGLESIPGICEWLHGERSLTTSVYRLEGPDLWYLPAGTAPNNPLEALQSARLPVAMEELVSSFDWIVIDSPPVIPLADTSVWMRLADGILLVTRQGITDKRLLQKGLEVLDQKKLIGALLNCSQSAAMGDSYYYRAPSSVTRKNNQKNS